MVAIEEVIHLKVKTQASVIRQWQPIAGSQVRLADTSEPERPACEGQRIENGGQDITGAYEIKIDEEALADVLGSHQGKLMVRNHQRTKNIFHYGLALVRVCEGIGGSQIKRCRWTKCHIDFHSPGESPAGIAISS